MVTPKAYRIFTNHKRKPGEDDSHAWYVTGRKLWRAALGREGNGSWDEWLHVQCNVDACPAEAIVSESAIIALIPEGSE